MLRFHRKINFIAFLFLCIIFSSNCQWHNALEFWSDLICSMRGLKTVNFYNVLDSNNKDSHLLQHYFEILIYRITQKCEMTVISKMIYMPQNLRNISLTDNNNRVICRTAKRTSIWKFTSDDCDYDMLDSQAIFSSPSPSPSTATEILIPGDETVHGWNTWNLHVILMKDIRFFDEISKSNSIFEWNQRDRFIVLIAHRRKEREQLKQSNLMINDILRTLWYKRRMQNIFVSQVILINNTTWIDRIVRTYNPFVKFNNSAWGKIEIININTKKQTSDMMPNLTYRRTKNLNGYEVKVGIFEQFQSNIQISENSTAFLKNILKEYPELRKSFNSLALETIARYMNFKVKQIYPNDNATFGHQSPNGTYTGALGDVVYGRTDIVFVSYFIKKYGINVVNDIEFTTYVEFDRVCVVVPKAAKIPKWLRIYHFFPPSVWLCSLLSHLFTYLTWYFLQILTPYRTQRTVFIKFYPSFLLSAGCPQKMPETNAERILLAGIFLGSITLVGIFNGILYNSFASDMYYNDIDLLMDLDNAGLPISYFSSSLIDLFGNSDDNNTTPVMQNLRKKLQQSTTNALKNAAYYRNVSGLIREHHFPIIMEELTGEDGAELLHLVEECPGIAHFYSAK